MQFQLELIEMFAREVGCTVFKTQHAMRQSWARKMYEFHGKVVMSRDYSRIGSIPECWRNANLLLLGPGGHFNEQQRGAHRNGQGTAQYPQWCEMNQDCFCATLSDVRREFLAQTNLSGFIVRASVTYFPVGGLQALSGYLPNGQRPVKAGTAQH
jgi:hypothetical protein